MCPHCKSMDTTCIGVRKEQLSKYVYWCTQCGAVNYLTDRKGSNGKPIEGRTILIPRKAGK